MKSDLTFYMSSSETPEWGTKRNQPWVSDDDYMYVCTQFYHIRSRNHGFHKYILHIEINSNLCNKIVKMSAISTSRNMSHGCWNNKKSRLRTGV